MDLKEKIIDAVIDEFNDKGLKFTMDDIAGNIGISKRTLYTVIKDKEALFIEAIDHVFAEIKNCEREIANDDSLDILDKLKSLLIVMPEKYKTVDFRQLYDLKEKYPRIYKKVENNLNTDWDLTYEVMKQAIAEGKIRQISFPVFKAIFSGTIEYYLSRSVLIDNQMEYEEALNQMLDIVMNGIKS
ncbi:MAG TPA: TetR/AcrR family transcriptional regulator [Clostridiales bacterium]|nr:TetR/AcrR family transcriptional regulator [Clostridiales bacterium]